MAEHYLSDEKISKYWPEVTTQEGREDLRKQFDTLMLQLRKDRQVRTPPEILGRVFEVRPMPTINERIEANADLTLWCVHVLGPDDVYAAPTHDAAAVHARELNKAVFGRANTPDDVMCFAYAAPWPHSKEDHANALKEWLEETA